MEIELISGALGAEVKGIDLKDSSIENWNVINDLLLEHKVLFFRNQNITSEEQLNLARKFGPLERHIYVKGREKYPEILNACSFEPTTLFAHHLLSANLEGQMN